jgi:hypothetical protein
MQRLEPCPACHRHVLVSEQTCPFCGQDVRALAALPARAMPTRRLGRAALFAFGVGATASSSVGCVEEPEPEGSEGDAQADSGAKADAGGDSGNVVALYGLAVPDAGFGGGQPGGALIPDAGPGGDLGGAVALYGLAPPPDAGAPKDAGWAQDAALDAGGWVAPYGLASPPVAKDAGGPGGDLGGVIALYGVAPVPVDRTKDAGSVVPLYGLPATPDETS